MPFFFLLSQRTKDCNKWSFSVHLHKTKKVLQYLTKFTFVCIIRYEYLFLCRYMICTNQRKHTHSLAFHKHIAKHFHKHTHAYVHAAQHVQHALMHCGELLLVLIIGLSGIMFANFSGSLEWLERNGATEISTYLLDAIKHPENILKKWNLISIWKVDDSIENTFTKWYCTYGAARISPEFFPFIDETTQQRTRWGNAVNRCENAEATWYKIWNTPAQWALVVYDAGGRFGQYGHVGKVMHYDRWLKKIIVRDMARVSTFTMSDRRDDLTTANVKCYIYNVRDAVTWPILTGSVTAVATWATQTSTWKTQTWTTTNVQIPVVDTHTSAPDTSNTNTDNQHTTPTIPSTPVVVTPPVVVKPPVVTPPVIVEPEQPVVANVVSDKNITLTFDDVHDYLAQHYIGQRDIQAKLTSKTSMTVGDEAVLTITITDKSTQEDISGLLPIMFWFITSNDNISIDYSSIKLISDGKIEIHIQTLQAGQSSLIINFWEEKIGRVWFDIQ